MNEITGDSAGERRDMYETGGHCQPFRTKPTIILNTVKNWAGITYAVFKQKNLDWIVWRPSMGFSLYSWNHLRGQVHIEKIFPLYIPHSFSFFTVNVRHFFGVHLVTLNRRFSFLFSSTILQLFLWLLLISQFSVEFLPIQKKNQPVTWECTKRKASGIKYLIFNFSRIWAAQ